MDQDRRKVVLGLGNILYQDEGFGVYALRAAQKQHEALGGVEWIDGGVIGLDLLAIVEECSHLLVLDAIDAGRPAGSLVELSGEEIPYGTGMRLSEHQLGFQEVLGLAKIRQKLPGQLRLLGVQPAELALGVGLSETVRAALPAVTRRAGQIILDWES